MTVARIAVALLAGVWVGMFGLRIYAGRKQRQSKPFASIACPLVRPLDLGIPCTPQERVAGLDLSPAEILCQIEKFLLRRPDRVESLGLPVEPLQRILLDSVGFPMVLLKKRAMLFAQTQKR